MRLTNCFAKFIAGLLIIALAVGLTGCSPKAFRTSTVESVTLECVQICLKQEDKPFVIKTYNDREAIVLFMKAIKKAKRINGSLDYGAYFHMTITARGGSRISYTLNVGNTYKSQRGLLVPSENTEQGYSIPEDITGKLRKLIYTRI